MPYPTCRRSHSSPPQLTAKDQAALARFADLADDGAALRALGVAHGDLVFLLYHFERQVGDAAAGCCALHGLLSRVAAWVLAGCLDPSLHPIPSLLLACRSRPR